MELVEILGARVRRQDTKTAKKDDSKVGTNNEDDVPPDMDDDVPPNMGASTVCTPPPVASTTKEKKKDKEEVVAGKEEEEAHEELSAAEALILQSVLQRNHYVYGEDSSPDTPNTDKDGDQSEEKVDVTAAATAAQEKHDQQVRERMTASTDKDGEATVKTAKKNQWGLPIAKKVIGSSVGGGGSGGSGGSVVVVVVWWWW